MIIFLLLLLLLLIIIIIIIIISLIIMFSWRSSSTVSPVFAPILSYFGGLNLRKSSVP